VWKGRDKYVRYGKPEIHQTAPAVEKIEGSGAKWLPLALEYLIGPIICTTPAYEADE
jgi:hypothetical protein